MHEPPASGGPAAMHPVLARMRSLAPCSADLEVQVLALRGRIEAVAAKTVLGLEDTPTRRPRYILTGWACHYRHLSGGRRQIFSVALPGDGLGVFLPSSPLASTSILALTPLSLVDAGAVVQTAENSAGLAVLSAQAKAEQERMLRQIVRLGRLTAFERLADVFLELYERLEVVGQADDMRFACPLTQETLADMTGLSVVHVNRTLQELRRTGLVVIERGWVRIGDARSLARLADHVPQGPSPINGSHA